MPGPLEGVRVVELAVAIQGPAVGFFFSAMGAAVSYTHLTLPPILHV